MGFVGHKDSAFVADKVVFGGVISSFGTVLIAFFLLCLARLSVGLLLQA
jgi:hypothetical protein